MRCHPLVFRLRAPCSVSRTGPGYGCHSRDCGLLSGVFQIFESNRILEGASRWMLFCRWYCSLSRACATGPQPAGGTRSGFTGLLRCLSRESARPGSFGMWRLLLEQRTEAVQYQTAKQRQWCTPRSQFGASLCGGKVRCDHFPCDKSSNPCLPGCFPPTSRYLQASGNTRR